MAGINDNTFVYGVLDLISKSLKQQESKETDQWGGQANIVLFREHPDDEWVLTRARLIYPSGYWMEIRLNRGISDEEIDKAIANNVASFSTADLPPVVESADPTGEYLDGFSLLPVELQDPGAVPKLIEYGSHGYYMIEPTIPLGVDRNHHDFEYYAKWRLRNVLIERYDSNNQLMSGYFYHFVYDLQSRLTAALVERI